MSVLAHVETSPNSGHHWEWLVDGIDRRLDRRGQAVWHLKPVPWRPRQTFYIARLLLDDFRGPFPVGSSFVCQCSNVSCVNPAHWNRVLSPPALHLHARSNGWTFVHSRTNKPITVNTPLVVHAGDAATHVLVATPGLSATFKTLCGLDIYPVNIVVHPRGDLVTCRKGCT